MKPKRPIDNTAGINGMSAAANLVTSATDFQGSQYSRSQLSEWLGTEEGHEVRYQMGIAICVFCVLLFLAMSPSMAYSNSPWLPDWYANFLGKPVWGTIFTLFFGLCAFSTGVALYGLSTPYIGMKMRLRFYDPGGDTAVKSGYAMLADNMAMEVLLVMPLKIALFFGVVYPLLLLGYAWELVKSAASLVTGNPYTPKGDLDIYYERLQRSYAATYETEGHQFAESMLRCACHGVFTGRGLNIDKSEWDSTVRDALLGRFYPRFGPIDRYVTNSTPQPTEYDEHGHARRVSRKFDVI